MELEFRSEKGKNPHPLKSNFFEPTYYSAFLYPSADVSGSTGMIAYRFQAKEFIEFVEDFLDTRGTNGQVEARYLPSGSVWIGPFPIKSRSFPKGIKNKLERMVEEYNGAFQSSQPSYA